jgi:predicted HTH domain antitoxin
MIAWPLGKGIEADAMLIDLAATLFDREQLSLGLAARLAGLSYSKMVDELGRREIAVIRLEPEELERELAALGKLGRGR